MTTRAPSRLDDAEARVWRALDLVPRHHDVTLPRLGTSVHVSEVGDPTGPPVVFVHGGSVAGPSWGDLVAQLPMFRCLLLDRPGCGRSEPLEADGVDGLLHQAETLVGDVLDGLGLDRASVVGTSYGGAFALRAAAAHPDRVDRLVLVAWCLGMPATISPLWFRLGAVRGVRHLNGLVPATPRLLRSGLARFGMGRAIAEGRLRDEAIDWLVALYRETDILRHEMRTVAPVVGVRDGWDARLTWSDEVLAAVTAPTLVLYGDEDPFSTIEGVRSLADRMDDVRVEILPQAGHAPWLDQPERCVTAMVEHLPSPGGE